MISSVQPLSEIETARLRLRPMCAQDHAALMTLWHNAQVRRYLWDNLLVTPEQVQAVQQASDDCFSRWGCGMYTLSLATDPVALAGFCGMRDFEASGVPELLYGIHPDHWGEGLVSEAARALLDHAFVHCELPRIVAATDTPNQSSVKVMQRLGMGFVERKTWHGLDTVFYSLDRDEFLAS